MSQSVSPIKLQSPPKSNPKRTDFSIETLLKKNSSQSNKNQNPRSPTTNCTSDEDEQFEDSYSKPRSKRQLAFTDSRPGEQSLEKPGKRDTRFDSTGSEEKDMAATFSWLACTRFKPPKLPRSKKKTGCMRHGRGPRIPFAPHQISVLESTFSKSQYLSSDCIHRLADTLHLSETRVKIWFQNRRARYRRERESPSSSSTAAAHLQHMRNGEDQKMLSLSPTSAHGKSHSDSALIFSNSSSPISDTTSDDFNNRRSISKRKLSIPDFISMQIQHHRQAQQLQYYLQQGFSPSGTNPLIQSALQSSAAHGFPFQFGLPDLGSGLGYDASDAMNAQFSQFLCANGGSPFAPTSVPMQMSFP